MGNRFVFPAPKPTYSVHEEGLTFIKYSVGGSKKKNACLSCSNKEKTFKIPVRFIKSKTHNSPFLFIYFHGNSEDIGPHLASFLSTFGQRFSMNILVPEYPTYGVYKERDTSFSLEKLILDNARRVIEYARDELKFPLRNIVVIGRSLGSGVAVQLATQFELRGLVLISAYTSIRDIAKNLVGSCLSSCAPNIYRSRDVIHKLMCPVLFIHGVEDELIPHTMSEELHRKAIVNRELKLNDRMTHNRFSIESDIFAPMEVFLVNKLKLGEHLLNVTAMETIPVDSLATKHMSNPEEEKADHDENQKMITMRSNRVTTNNDG